MGLAKAKIFKKIQCLSFEIKQKVFFFFLHNPFRPCLCVLFYVEKGRLRNIFPPFYSKISNLSLRGKAEKTRKSRKNELISSRFHEKSFLEGSMGVWKYFFHGNGNSQWNWVFLLGTYSCLKTH